MSRYSARAPSEKHGAAASAVTLASDHVDLPERRDDVGDHRPREHLSERAHGVEAGWPHAHPVRTSAAVGHEIEAELAVAALGGDVDLARRHLLALDHELEVVH